MKSHIVKENETLSFIATNYEIPLNRLMYLNKDSKGSKNISLQEREFKVEVGEEIRLRKRDNP